MTRRPKVLHLTTTAISLDWLLSPQLCAFERAGFDVVTVSGGGDHVAALEAKGITHIEAPSLSRQVDPMSDLRSIAELRKVLSELRPDIVHTHNPKPGVIGRLVGRASHVPIVINTVHGLYAQPTDPLMRRIAVYGLERFAATCSDAELVQNPEDVATLLRLGVPKHRVHLLGNGIDLERFQKTPISSRVARAQRQRLGIDPQVPVIGMVGRLVWEKGYREFFDAIAELRQTVDAPFEVVVVGPTDVEAPGAVDQKTIDELTGLGVRFLGSRDDVDRLLHVFDVVALPSYREGFPRAAMEASAAGVPVVATDIRGCRQVVSPGETGLLVEPRSSSSLAAALRTLLADEVLRNRLGGAAARRARAEFDQDRVIARTLAVYRTLLADRGLPSAQPVSERYNASIDLVAEEASKRSAVVRAA